MFQIHNNTAAFRNGNCYETSPPNN